MCSKQIGNAAGTLVVRAAIEQDGSPQPSLEHVFHLSCFDAFTTGSSRDGDIWTYRIVCEPTEH